MSHRPSDLLNVVWLVRTSHRNSRDTWQIDQSQIGASMRVNIEDDRLVNDALLRAGHLVCENIDALSNLLEFKELFARNFFEDSPRLGLVMEMVESKL